MRQRELSRRVLMLRQVDLLAPLSDDERAFIAERLQYAPFARGDVITKQGNAAHWLYILAFGEAEVLFDIDAATADADNHPSWRDLFVKAIANCVMAASGYATPPREIALARDAWLDRRGDLGLDSMVNSMATGLRGLLVGYREQSDEERAIARLTQQKIEIVTNEAITVAEATWLAQRIGRDGRMTPNEQALLMFLKAESPSIDPALRELVDRAATVAG